MMLLLLLMVVTPTLRISAVRLLGLSTGNNKSFLSGAVWGRLVMHIQLGRWQNTLLETECDVRNATADVDA